MNKKQLEKIKNKLKVVSDKLKNRDNYLDINLVNQRHELEFILNKQNINFRLSGTNKYFVAYQCKQFENNLKKYGFGHIKKDEIIKNGICFNNYSINNGYNEYCRDLKRFNNKHELIGFVIGYNESCHNSNTI